MSNSFLWLYRKKDRLAVANVTGAMVFQGTFPVALGLVAFIGLVSPGWSIGYGRYFYVNLVPAENRAGYIGLHSALELWKLLRNWLARLLGWA